MRAPSHMLSNRAGLSSQPRPRRRRRRRRCRCLRAAGAERRRSRTESAAPGFPKSTRKSLACAWGGCCQWPRSSSSSSSGKAVRSRRENPNLTERGACHSKDRPVPSH